MPKSLVIIILLSIYIPKLNAKVYYVDDNRNTKGNGSFNNPLNTIQQAAELMLPGDTCYIHGGIYRETIIPSNSGSKKAPIVFIPYIN